jgi:hypothetical protein
MDDVREVLVMRVLMLIVVAAVGCGDDKCPAWTKASGPDVCAVPEAGQKAPTPADSGVVLVDVEPPAAGKPAPMMIEEDAGAPMAGKPAEAGKGGDGAIAAGIGGAGTGGAGQGGAGVGGSAGMASYVADAGIDAAPAEFCGDGVVNSLELCDGKCPKESECKSAGCIVAKWSGSAAGCDAKCEMHAIAEAKSGDSCCPMGVIARDDSDCACGGDGDCGSNQYCAGGACHSQACSSDDQCTSDRWCTSTNVCGLKRDGLCTRDRQCPSGRVCKVDSVNGIGMCG